MAGKDLVKDSPYAGQVNVKAKPPEPTVIEKAKKAGKGAIDAIDDAAAPGKAKASGIVNDGKKLMTLIGEMFTRKPKKKES